MRIGRVIGRVTGTAALLGVAFVGGVSINDLRGVHTLGSLTTVVDMVPQRLSEAVLTAAHGQGDTYTPYQAYADVLATLRAGYYGKDIDPTQMTYNGIRGMVGATHDRYTIKRTRKRTWGSLSASAHCSAPTRPSRSMSSSPCPAARPSRQRSWRAISF